MALSLQSKHPLTHQAGASRPRGSGKRLHVVRAVDRDQPDTRNRRSREPKPVVEPEIIDVSSYGQPYEPPRPSDEEMQAVMELAATMTPQERQEFVEYMRTRNWQDFEESLREDDLEGNLEAMREAFGAQVDTTEFWESAVWDPLVLDVLRSQLSISEVELMDRLMGDSWERVGELDEGDIMAQLGGMSPVEQEMLLSILQKLQMLKEQMEASGLIGGIPNFDEPTSTSSSSSSGEGSFPGAQVIVDTTATSSSSRGTDGNSSSSSTSTSSSSSRGSPGQASNQGSFPGGEDISRVTSYLRHAEDIKLGLVDWGPQMQPSFQTLKSIHAQLVELDELTPETMEQQGLEEGDVEAAYAALNEQLAMLMMELAQQEEGGGGEEGEGQLDDATRSALLWMDACLTEDGQGTLSTYADALSSWGTFLAAAEALEVLKVWAVRMEAVAPQLKLTEVLEAAGLDDAEWFVPLQQRDQALAACEAAALAAERAAEDEGTAYSGPPPSVSISFALRPFIDQQRIEWLAALDADNLRFMVDMERNKHSEDVFIKWSLHPTVGPKLMSGEWYKEQQLPGMLQALYKEAQVPISGLDELFKFDFGPFPGSGQSGRGSSSGMSAGSSRDGAPRPYGPPPPPQSTR